VGRGQKCIDPTCHKFCRFYADARHPELSCRLSMSAPFFLESLEPRVLFSGTQNFVDADGDRYSVKLSGPGTLVVAVDLPDVNGHGPIGSVTLTGTTARSALTVSISKVFGDGVVSIGSIADSGDLASITATHSDLAGSGIDIGGRLGKVHLRNVLDGADFTVGGDAKHSFSLKAGVVGDSSNVTSNSPIASITVTSFGDGAITAPSIGAIRALAGAFSADVATPGSLGSLAVTGGDDTGIIDAAKIGPITVKADKHGVGGGVAHAVITLSAASGQMRIVLRRARSRNFARVVR
jgi:hypothetical protein